MLSLFQIHVLVMDLPFLGLNLLFLSSDLGVHSVALLLFFLLVVAHMFLKLILQLFDTFDLNFLSLELLFSGF